MMHRGWIARLCVPAVVLLSSATAAAAQAPLRIERFPPEPAAAPAAQAANQPSTARLVAVGLAGGLVGWLGGGLLGAVIADNDNDDDIYDVLGGFLVGSTIGESVGLATGVHLANRREGRVLPAMLASLGIGAAGIGIAFATQDSDPLPGIVLGLTPIAQLITTIAIERNTAR